MNDKGGGDGGGGGHTRRLQDVVRIDLGAGVTLQVDIGVIASGIIVQPPRPPPKAMLILEDDHPEADIRRVEVTITRVQS